MTAINYCHNQGIAHRDLKMENVLFLNEQKNSPIKIIDFGLSQCVEKKKLVQIITGKNYGDMVMNAAVGTPHYISPEVLNGKYNQKCDIWSAGVILFILLGGYFPFDGNTDTEVYKAIKKKKFVYEDEAWSNISNEAKDLINHMLIDEDKRYSAEEVLKHPWFTKMAPNPQRLRGAKKINIKQLENYKNNCNFKKFVLTYMATRLKEKEIQELRRMFLRLDKNKDGILSVDEIKRCFVQLNEEQKLNISSQEIQDIFKSIDLNNSKKIEYTEFISSMLEESAYCKEEKLMNIFRLLDKDGSGKISKNELKKALNNENISDQDLKTFIQKFDLDEDGEIDYTEFVNGMSDVNKEK
jgi:calcium-dependent protein kinase